MGLVRTGITVGLIALSFYGGYKYRELKPLAVIEQRITIEDHVKSLLNENRDDVMKALYRVGKDYRFEKQNKGDIYGR